MNELKKAFRKCKWDSILAASLAIIVGILFIVLPSASANVLCAVAGILLIAVGVFSVVAFISGGLLFGGSALIFGLAFLLSGLFFLIHPEMIKGILTVLFGIFIVADGASTMVDSIYCAKARVQGWFWLLLLSAISIVLGCVVTFGTFDTVMLFAGISLIVDGIGDLIITLFFSHKIKEAKKTIERRADDIIID